MRRARTIFVIIILCMVCAACTNRNTLFRQLDRSATGIDFINKVNEDTLVNVLEYMNVYTGAGVAAGDINNDGLPDLYFSANRGGGQLYLNRGNLRFENITRKAGLVPDRWETGVAMVDINQDGWLDIYVNVAGSAKFGNLANMLYVNQRNGTFREEAEKYGIADTRLTMNANFFDYDGDRDLDLFLVTNPADEMLSGINMIVDRKVNGESSGTDILYRNNGNGTFTDVSAEAGILIEGYSLGSAISDVNGDGRPDIYVSNDFLSNDILYINNGNGTFTDRIQEFLKHTSFASMGADIADFNNDSKPDIYVLDMLPEDNFRRKMIMPAASYDKLQLSVARGYSPQYSRNTLQLNNGNGTFSDIAFLSGVSSTDWSWSALFADYDNDGDKDLMVTNGFYRDLGNLDYIHYQARLNNPMGKQDAKREARLKAIRELPKIPLTDYLFENTGDLQFRKRSEDWGFTTPGFSNGATYADLDNDGDLDIVINCFNEPARVYENTAAQNNNGYIRLRLLAEKPNVQAVGTKVYVYTDGKVQFSEYHLSRGYESSVEPVVHFGIGEAVSADSIIVVWPDNNIQKLRDIPANRVIDVKQLAAATDERVEVGDDTIYTEENEHTGISYTHVENDFVDFKVQPLLPHMHSRNGPGIAVGDANGDGLEDFYVGGAVNSKRTMFIQQKDGKFTQKEFTGTSASEDQGVLFFDADADNDLDLYVVSGGSEYPAGSVHQQDRLYLNDGSGQFADAPAGALPDTKSSGSCVVATDFDHDGDMDLFVGGRVTPGKYPVTPKSYLLRNDSHNGVCRFTDIADASLSLAGMVTSALWTDVDNDGWMDLLVAGEFMPITIYKNSRGTLQKDERKNGLEHTSGWWNSLAGADIDQDGDMDYFAGNLGLNSRHKASPEEPLCIYAKDFDGNGLLDPVMCYYVEGKNYIYPSRDEMIRQINSMRGRFPTYESYASVSFEESFTAKELDDAVVVKSETFATSFIENLGQGIFRIVPLPMCVQVSPVYGILAEDFDNDGRKEILMAGNSYATEASTGRYDAMQAVLIMRNSNNHFIENKKGVMGLLAGKDVKGLVRVHLADGSDLLLVANNNDKMEAYRRREGVGRVIVPRADDAYLIVESRSGKYKHELYHGSNYFSSSSRTVRLPGDVENVIIYNNKGEARHETF